VAGLVLPHGVAADVLAAAVPSGRTRAAAQVAANVPGSRADSCMATRRKSEVE